MTFKEFLTDLPTLADSATVHNRGKNTRLGDAPASHQAAWLRAVADEWEAKEEPKPKEEPKQEPPVVVPTHADPEPPWDPPDPQAPLRRRRPASDP